MQYGSEEEKRLSEQTQGVCKGSATAKFTQKLGGDFGKEREEISKDIIFGKRGKKYQSFTTFSNCTHSIEEKSPKKGGMLQEKKEKIE